MIKKLCTPTHELLLVGQRTEKAYHDSRLENPEVDFLTTEHIDELRDHSEIVLWDDYTGTKEYPGIGSIQHIGIVTKQGYCYDCVLGIPENPRSDRLMIGTSAWFTGTEGHNMRTVRNILRSGNYTLFMGAEGSYKPANAIEPLSPISLANSAAALLNTSYHVVDKLREDGHVLDDEARYLFGESRGAMTGLGVLALQHSFAQNIDYADLVAPCIPQKIDSLVDITRLAEQITQEPVGMIKLLGKLGLSRTIHYSKTIDINWYSLKHQLEIGGALFNGITGQFPPHIPKTQLLHTGTFDNDFASMRGVWEEKFIMHPNVRITSLPGGHMTIADTETLRYFIARLKSAQDARARNEKLTPENVFDAAHYYAPRQHPIAAISAVGVA